MKETTERTSKPGRRPGVAQMTLVSLMTALIAAGAQIAIPLPLVPINLALLAVLLTGFLLERRYAVVAVFLYLSLGALGLPVFSGFRGGPQVLFGPTGGYLLGYLFSIGVIVLLREWADNFVKRLLICALAILACYIPGTLWLLFLTGKALPEVLAFAVLPFLPGDILKAIAASSIAPRLQKAVRLRSI